jgi:DNA-binding FadR family transcriptional regulator
MNSPPRPTPGPRVVNKRRTMKISESVTREIVADISNLEPGTMLPPEAKLLERYQVGRASLREALRVLEMQGLIVIRPGPGGGPMVAQADNEHFGRMASLFFHMSGATYRDVMEARLIVEPSVAALVAAQQDPEQMKVLEAFVARTEDDTTDDRTAEFHTMLIDMTNNPVVALLSHCVQDYAGEEQHAGVLTADEEREIDAAHIAIARTIIRGHSTKTAQLMYEHMEQFRRLIVERRPSMLDEVVSWRAFNQ